MQQPAQDLLAVELLPPSVLLHHHVRNLVDALVCREALIAALALAPPPYRVRLFALARIHHAVLREPAVRTLHRPHIIENKIDTVTHDSTSAIGPTQRSHGPP